jgi:hypothetical protein
MSCISVEKLRTGGQSARNVDDCRKKCLIVDPTDSIGVFYNETNSVLECRCRITNLLDTNGADNVAASFCNTECPDSRSCGGAQSIASSSSFFSIYAPQPIAEVDEEVVTGESESTTLVIGAIFGGIFVLGLIAFICCVIVRRRRDTKKMNEFSSRNKAQTISRPAERSIYYSKSVESSQKAQPLTMDTMFFVSSFLD